MGWAIRAIDLDEVYRTSSVPPVLGNDFNIKSEEHRKVLNDLIYTHYEGDTLSTFPTCDCGEVRGVYNEGIICSICDTEVRAVTERPLESYVWIESPKGVAPFISPIFWIILSKALTYNSVNLLEYLVNPTYQVQGTIHKKVRQFMNLEIERGINYFYPNFDNILNILYNEKILKGQVEDIMEMVRLYRNCVFTYHLPLPSKLGMITEKTAINSYTDNTILYAIDALRTITSAVHSPIPLSSRLMQARAMQANGMLATYHDLFMRDSLGTKEGLSRSHIFAGRLHHTFRTVIVSLSDRHEYDEIHIPWGVAMMVLKTHIYSKLIRRGYSPKECNALIHEHVTVYHPLLDEIFQELIRESPYGGIPATWARNPSLVRQSIQLMRITKVKTNPKINATSMSVLTLVGPNADFDGDRHLSPFRRNTKVEKTSLIAGNSSLIIQI